MSEILSDVLANRRDAIFYELSRALKAAFPEKVLLETQDDAFQVHGFSHAGHCRMREADGAHTHWTQGWNGRRNQPYAKLESGWLRIEWEGHEFLIVTTGILGQYCREVRSYVVAPSMSVAREFFNAVCRWGSEVHGEVLVFREGRWSKSEELFESIQSTSLDGLVLPPQLKEEVTDNVRSFFGAEETYTQYGLPWKRGLLFLGPPGNGKTHMIKGLAKELGKPCLYVRSFRSQYGTDHDNIGKAFEKARDLAPCLLVLEDLDALVDDKKRSYFLNEMDGFYSNRGILTVATTNHPERLDPAILERPSRFDRKFTFPLPDEPERLRYLRRQIASLEEPLRMSDEALMAVAERTEEFSYAYLKELVLSSMMAWIREDGKELMDEVLPTQLESLRGQMMTEASIVSVTERVDPLDGLPPAMRAAMERTGRRR